MPGQGVNNTIEPVLGLEQVDPSTGLSFSKDQAEQIFKSAPRGASGLQYPLTQVGGLSPAEHRVIGDQYHPEMGYEHFQEQLAQNQSGIGQLGNALLQGIVGEVFGGTLEGIGYLGDLPQYINIINGTEQEFGNWLSDIGKSIRTWSQETAPVFVSPTQKQFAPGHWSWWMQNLPSVLSTLSLFIPTEGAVRGLGVLGRAMNISTKLGKEARWMITGIGQAIMSRHMESMMEAANDAQQIEQYYKSKGLSPEEARRKAAEAAANTYRKNWVLLAQDMPQYLIFGKLLGRGASNIERAVADVEKGVGSVSMPKSVLKDAVRKTSKIFRSAKITEEATPILKMLGIPSEQILAHKGLSITGNIASEGGEELYQWLVNTQSQNLVKNATDGGHRETSIPKIFAQNLDNGEMWTNAAMGAIGAGLMHAAIPLFKYKSTVKANEARVRQIKSWPAALTQAWSRYADAMERGNETDIKSAIANYVAKTVLASKDHGNLNYYTEFLEGLRNDPDEVATIFNIPKEDLEGYKNNPEFLEQVIQQTKTFKKHYEDYLKEAANNKNIPGKGKTREHNIDYYASNLAYVVYMKGIYEEQRDKVKQQAEEMDISHDQKGDMKFEDISNTGQEILKRERKKAYADAMLNGIPGKENSKGLIAFREERAAENDEANKSLIEELDRRIEKYGNEIEQLDKELAELNQSYTPEEKIHDSGFQPDPDKLAENLDLQIELGNIDEIINGYENGIRSFRSGEVFKETPTTSEESKKQPKGETKPTEEIPKPTEGNAPTIEGESKLGDDFEASNGEGEFSVGKYIQYNTGLGDLVNKGIIRSINLAKKNQQGDDIEPDLANDDNIIEVELVDEKDNPTGEIKRIPQSLIIFSNDKGIDEESSLDSSDAVDEATIELEMPVESTQPYIAIPDDLYYPINLLQYTTWERDVEGNRILSIRDKELNDYLSNPNTDISEDTAEYYVNLQDSHVKSYLKQIYPGLSESKKKLVDKLLNNKFLTEKQTEQLLSTLKEGGYEQLVDEFKINVRIKSKDGQIFDNDSGLITSKQSVVYPPVELRDSTSPTKDDDIAKWRDQAINTTRQVRKALLMQLLTGKTINITGLSKGRGGVRNKKGIANNPIKVFNLDPNKLGLAISKPRGGSKEMNEEVRLYDGKDRVIIGPRAITTVGGVYLEINDTANGKPFYLKLNKTPLAKEHSEIVFEAFKLLAHTAVRKGKDGKYELYVPRGKAAKRAARRGSVGKENVDITEKTAPILYNEYGVRGLNIGELLDLLVYWGRSETDPTADKYKGAPLTDKQKALLKERQLYLHLDKKTKNVYLVYGVNENGQPNYINLSDPLEAEHPDVKTEFVEWLMANKTYPVHLVNGRLNLELNGQFMTNPGEAKAPIAFSIGKQVQIARGQGEKYNEFLLKNGLITTDVIEDEKGRLFDAPGVNLNIGLDEEGNLVAHARTSPKPVDYGVETPVVKERVTKSKQKQKISKTEKPKKRKGESPSDILKDFDTFAGRAGTRNKYVVQDLDTELRVAARMIGVKDVTVVKDLATLMRHGKENFALYIGSGILLYEGAETGTIYHEAFHKFSLGLLRNAERAKLYRTARIVYNMPKNKYTDRQVEEKLAEEFREYVLLREKNKVHGKIREFFDRIIRFFEKLFFRIAGRWTNRIALTDIDRLFNQLYNGKFKWLNKSTESGLHGEEYARIYHGHNYEYLATHKDRKEMATILAMKLLKISPPLSFNTSTHLNFDGLKNFVVDVVKRFKTAAENETLTEEERELALKNYLRFNEVLGEEISPGTYENWPDFIELIDKYLATIGINRKLNKQKEDGGSLANDWGMSSYEISLKDNAYGAIKFLIAQLPSTSKANEYGFIIPVEFGRMWNKLFDDLHDAKSINEMISRLETIAMQRDYAAYTTLAKQLKNGSKTLRNQFYTVLRSAKNDFITVNAFNAHGNTSINITGTAFDEADRGARAKWSALFLVNPKLTHYTSIGKIEPDYKRFGVLYQNIKYLTHELEKKQINGTIEDRDIENILKYTHETLNELAIDVDFKTVRYAFKHLYEGDTDVDKAMKLLNNLRSLIDPKIITTGDSIFSYTIIENLGAAYSFLYKDLTDRQVSGPENNPIFIYSLPNAATDIVDYIKDSAGYVEEKRNRLYNKHSRILNFFLPPKNATAEEKTKYDKRRTSLFLKTLAKFKSNDYRDTGRHIRRLSPIEDYLMKLNAMGNDALVPFPVLADRKTYYFFGVENDKSYILKNVLKKINDNNTYEFSDEVIDMYYGYYLDEQERIKAAKKLRKQYENATDPREKRKLRRRLIKNYHYSGNYDLKGGNAYSFTDFKGFNLNMKREDFAVKLNKVLTKQLNKELAWAKSINAISEIGDTGKLKSGNFTSKLTHSVLDIAEDEFNSITETDLIKHTVAFGMINMAMGMFEAQKIFVADPAMFKRSKRTGDTFDDMFKRTFGIASSGSKFAVNDENGTNTYSVAVLSTNTFKSDSYDALLSYHIQLYTKQILADNPHLSKEKAQDRAKRVAEKRLKAYLEVDPTDGQMFITAKAYKHMMDKLGQWDETRDKAFNLLESDRELTPQEESDALNIVLNPIKTVYYGHHNFNGVDLLIYDKMSMAVLFRRVVDPTFGHKKSSRVIAEGLGKAMVYRPIKRLLDRMELKGEFADNKNLRAIDAVKFDTAVKTGQLEAGNVYKSVSTNKDFDINNMTDLTDIFVFDQSYDYLRHQVVTDPHSAERTKVGTAIYKVALSNVVKDKPYGKFKTGQELLDHITKLRNAVSNIGVKQLEAQLDIQHGIVSNESLINILKQSAKAANRSDDMIEGLKVDANGEMYLNLDSFTDRKWLYQRLMSIVNKKTLDLVFPGNQLIQVSDYGMGNVKSNTDLKFMRFDSENEKIDVMETRISIKMFKHYFPEYAHKSFDELKKIIESSDLEILGYRIPTQGQSSITILRVKEILPEQAGDVIYLPLEFTALTGSDFDIDKLFTMLYYYEYKNGKLLKVQYSKGNTKTDIQKRYNAKLEELLSMYMKNNRNAITRELLLFISNKDNNLYPVAKDAETETFSKFFNSDEYKSIPEIGTRINILLNKLDILQTKYFNTKNDTLRASILNNINDTMHELREYESYIDIAQPLINKIKQQAKESALEITSKILQDAGLFVSLEDFAKLPIEEQNTEQAIKNELLDTLMTVLKDPKHHTNISTPLGSIIGVLKNMADDYAIQYDSSTSISADSLEVGTLHYQSDKRSMYSLSKRLVAPFVLANVSHVLFQHAGIKMRVSDVLKGGPISRTDHTIALDKLKDIEEIPILDWISAIIDGTVDFVKNPYLANLNVNYATSDVIIFMLRAGLGRTTFRFVNQPVIRDYVNNAINAHGFVGKLDDPFELTINHVVDAALKTAIKEGVVEKDATRDDIVKLLNGSEYLGDLDYILNNKRLTDDTRKDRKKNFEYYKRQYLVIKAYEALEKEAKKLTSLTILSRIDTQGFGSTPAEMEFMLNRIDEALADETWVNVDKLLDYHKPYKPGDTFLPTLINNTIVLVRKILANKSMYSAPSFLSILHELVDNTQMGTISSTSTINNVAEDIFAYFAGQFMVDPNNGLNLTRQAVLDLIRHPKKSLFMELAKIKSGNSKYSEELKDNRFINMLILDTLKDSDVPITKQIKMPFRNFEDVWETDDYIEDFRELINSPHEELNMLAVKLFVYAFYTSGFRSRLRSYYSYMPLILNKEFRVKDSRTPDGYRVVSFDRYIKDIMGLLNNLDFADIMLPEIKREVFQNNWYNSNIVPHIASTAFDLVKQELKNDVQIARFAILKKSSPQRSLFLRRNFRGMNDLNAPVFKSYIFITDASLPHGGRLAEYIGYDKDNNPIYRFIPLKGYSYGGYVLKEFGGFSQSIVPEHNKTLYVGLTTDEIYDSPQFDIDYESSIKYAEDNIDGFTVVPLNEQSVDTHMGFGLYETISREDALEKLKEGETTDEFDSQTKPINKNTKLMKENETTVKQPTGDIVKPVETKGEKEIPAKIEGAIKFVETKSTKYAPRTYINASADATIAFAIDFTTAGEKLTKKAVKSLNKKYIPIDLNNLTVSDERVNKIVDILNEINAKSINIAGNGIYTLSKKYTQKEVDDFVYNLLYKVVHNKNLKNKINLIRSGGQTGVDEAGAKAAIKLGIPTIITAPKGWMMRTESGDIWDEYKFKSRFIGKKEEIPSKTETGNVVIPKTSGTLAERVKQLKEYTKKVNGIYAMRGGGDVNPGSVDFGNPFTGSGKTGPSIVKSFSTIAEAVQAYKDWLTSDKYDFVEPKINDIVNISFDIKGEYVDVKARIVKLKRWTSAEVSNPGFSVDLENIKTGKKYGVFVDEDGMISQFEGKRGLKVGTDNYIKEFDLTDKYPQLFERKQQILRAIKSGKLKGKPIIYYKELDEPSHANVLDELINGVQTPIRKTTKEIPQGRAKWSTKDNPIKLFVDGSDLGKGTEKSQVGFGAYFKVGDTVSELSGGPGYVKKALKQFGDIKVSNPTMEMLGLAAALGAFKNTAEHIVVYQDYTGAISYDGLWQRAANNTHKPAKPWRAKEPYIRYAVERAVKAIESIEKNGGSVVIKQIPAGHKSLQSYANEARSNPSAFLNEKGVFDDNLVREIHGGNNEADRLAKAPLTYYNGLFEELVELNKLNKASEKDDKEGKDLNNKCNL